MSEWNAYADEVNVSLPWLNATTPSPILKPHITAPTSGISELIVPMYVAIFLLAVVGNALVVVTLVQNKRMRTVTNVYLLNLVSLLLNQSVYSTSARWMLLCPKGCNFRKPIGLFLKNAN